MGEVGLMSLRVPGASWREVREIAMLADELGYSSLSTGEAWGEGTPLPRWHNWRP